jgi:Flp pilus assembly protein TadD
LLLLFVLTACATRPGYRGDVMLLAPLQLDGTGLSVSEALVLAPTPDLLGLSDEMREFMDRYVNVSSSQRQRLRVLHRSLRSDAMVGLDYDPDADGTAAEVFHRGEANCLSYAHLFVSLARYAGLDARYHAMELRPDWSRHGSRIALRRHVNIWVKLKGGEEYMIDIEPVQRTEVAGSRLLTDAEAFALYHNNLAMDELLREQVVGAYAQSVRAVELSADTSYLWVNLGAIYRLNGQEQASEDSYQTALQLDPGSPSAMNNLVVLYHAQGRQSLANHWETEVAAYRQRNPYYHSHLGLQAEKAGDLPAAAVHFLRAIELEDEDADFYYQLGRLYYSMQRSSDSVRYLELAIEHSRLKLERERYEAFLKQVNERSVATL